MLGGEENQRRPWLLHSKRSYKKKKTPQKIQNNCREVNEEPRAEDANSVSPRPFKDNSTTTEA